MHDLLDLMIFLGSVYLLIMSILMRTRTIEAAVMFKIIPFIVGLGVLLGFFDNIGMLYP